MQGLVAYGSDSEHDDETVPAERDNAETKSGNGTTNSGTLPIAPGFYSSERLARKYPVPQGSCENHRRLLQSQMNDQRDITDTIKSNSEFGNPEILQKVVNHFNINELESHFHRRVFSPLMQPHEYYDTLMARPQSSTAKRPRNE